jgi:hypothetical protein
MSVVVMVVEVYIVFTVGLTFFSHYTASGIERCKAHVLYQ